MLPESRGGIHSSLPFVVTSFYMMSGTSLICIFSTSIDPNKQASISEASMSKSSEFSCEVSISESSEFRCSV